MDSETHSQVSALESKVSRLEASISRVDRRVDALENNVLRAVSELQQTMDEFITDYRRDRIIQNAYNELAEAEREWDQEFGHYKEARELAAEIIYVVRSGFISRAVILDVTERLAIRMPRYWLAPAILAVAAWLDDDKDRYFDSIKSALTFNHSKSALFMTLLLRHQARNELMREWIGTYLAGLEPTNLPTDFGVVIEAVAGRTLGADSAPQLVRRMRAWYEHAASSRDAEAEEIGQWERNLLGLAAAGNYAEEFPALAQRSPTWELLRKRHEANTAVEAADQYFRSRFEEGADVPADLDEKISLLLKRLAEDPDQAENRILQKIRRAEAVIETQDSAAAQRRVAAEEADRARTLNILSLVTREAFPTGRRRPPTMTELLAITMSQRFISAAAERIHGKHQRAEAVEVNLGRWRRSFACATDAETTPEALRRQAEDFAEELAQEIDQQTARQRGRLRQWASRRLLLAALVSCALLATAFFLLPASLSSQIFIVILAVLIFAAAASDRFLRLRRQLQKALDNAKQEKNDVERTLIRVAKELAALFSQEQQGSRLLPGLQAYLLGLKSDDVYRATRFTGPPQRPPSLPGPSDRGVLTDAGSTEEEHDKYARGFPGWTPWPPPWAPQIPEGPTSLL